MIQPAGQSFGQLLKQQKFSDFELSEAVYNSKIKTPRHSHDWSFICLILKGSYAENYGDAQYIRRTSTVFFHPAGELHQSDFSSAKAGIFQVEIKPQRLAQIDYRTGVFQNPLNFAPGGAEFLLARKIYREFNLMDEVSPIAIEGLVLELLAQAVRSVYAKKNTPREVPHWLKEAKDFLNDNFAETFSLAAIAAPVGVHPAYLATKFRHCYGLTIGEYLRRLRVDFACRQLSGSNASLVEIALAAGFCSQSHLTRTFKSLTGYTPAQYRSVSRNS